MLRVGGLVPVLGMMVCSNKNMLGIPPSITTLDRYLKRVAVKKFQQIGELKPSAIKVVEEHAEMVVVSVEPSVSWVDPELVSLGELPYSSRFARSRRAPEDVNFGDVARLWRVRVLEPDDSASVSKYSRRMVFSERAEGGAGLDLFRDFKEIRTGSFSSGELSMLKVIAVLLAILRCFEWRTFGGFQVRRSPDETLDSPEGLALGEGDIPLEVRGTRFSALPSEDEVRHRTSFGQLLQSSHVIFRVVVQGEAPMFRLRARHSGWI